MQVKICGITNLEDALLSQDLGAHALGFIFYPRSQRFIPPEQAANIIKQLSIFTHKVGVFVNEIPEYINDMAGAIGLSAVQVHGEETPQLLEKINYPIIKSFRVNPEFDFSELLPYNKYTILLDTYSEKEIGGTGTVFNWQIIPKEIRSEIILAGGVSSENIEQIYQEINPLAVDLSSSVESSPGIKDPKKLLHFFKKITQRRNATAQK
jgi:phosphoribosylanthranilate isomerase